MCKYQIILVGRFLLSIQDKLNQEVSNSNKEKMTILRDHVLLNTPISVLIDPANLCNFNCTFCPTGDKDLLKKVGRPEGVMDWGLYTKVIKDLEVFPSKIKALLLFKDGEPLLNKYLSDMVILAKEKKVANSISITTNGALLTREWSKKLIGAGLDSIRISVEHVSNEGYKAITRRFDNYEKIIENVRILYEERNLSDSKMEIHVKIVDAGLREEEKEKFYRDFHTICDSINIDHLMGWSSTEMKDFTLGMDVKKGMTGANKLFMNRLICPSPFKTLAINFNGEVSVCCVDWSMKTIVGDVHNESLVEIWNGENLRRFRLKHAQGKRHEISPCSNCHHFYGYGPESDIDSEQNRLISILS